MNTIFTLSLRKVFFLSILFIFQNIGLKAAVDEITITFNNTQLCAGTIYDVGFISTLPANTLHKVQLLKAGIEVAMVESTTNPLSFKLPNTLEYGTDYSMKISAGVVESAEFGGIVVGNLRSGALFDQANEYFGGNTVSLCTGSELSKTVIFKKYLEIGTEPINTPYSLEWFKNDISLNNTTNNYTITTAGNYKVKVYQAGCLFSSNLPVIASNNQLFVYIEGNDNLIYCEGSGKLLYPRNMTATTTYQWNKDGITIAGATNREYTATTNGKYTVTATDKTCVGTNTYGQTISFRNSLPADIYSSSTVLCGNDPILNKITLSVGYSSGFYDFNNYPFTVKWLKDGQEIPNETKRGYSTSSPGSYKLQISQGNCSSFSKEIVITNGSQFAKPKFIYDPNNAISEFCNGTYTTYWDINTSLFKDGVLFSALSPKTLTQSGTYILKKGAGTSCEAESDPLMLNIGSTFVPKIISDYNKTTLCGTSDYVALQFANNQVNGNFSYQWQKDGIDITSNGTSAVLFVQTSNNGPGTYRCRVTNGLCTEFSNEITVTTNNTQNFDLKTIDNIISLGCSNSLVFIDHNYMYAWQSFPKKWFRNGIEIPNSDNFKLQTEKAGTYTLAYNYSGCIATSNPLVIQSDFVDKPAITQSQTATGTSATLTAIGCDGTVNWWSAATGGTALGTGTTFTTPILNAPANYFASCATATCESARNKRVIVLDTAPESIVVTFANAEYCVGSSISVPFTSSLGGTTEHTLKLYKNGVEVLSQVSTNNPFVVILLNTLEYGNDYTIKISAFGTESNAVTLTILNPTITQSTVIEGVGGTLTATGCGSSQVRWYQPNGGYFTGSTLELYNNVTIGQVYKVSCYSTLCETPQKDYNVVVTPAVLTIDNAPTNMCVGSNYTLNISGNLPTTAYKNIQLYKGNTFINAYNGGQGNSFTFQLYAYNFELPYGIDYKIRIQAGSVYSDFSPNITLGNLQNVIFFNGDGPQINGQSLQLCTGAQMNFDAKITANSTFKKQIITDGVSFQWQKDNVNIGTNQNPITISQAGNYKVIASQGVCQQSTNFQVTMGSISTNIFPQNNTQFCDDVPQNIYPLYNSTTATYQWVRDGQNIAGTTSRILSTNISGQYSVKITDNTCMATSQATNVKFGTSLSVNISSTETTLCNNNTIILNSEIYGSFYIDLNNYSANIQWQKHQIDIVGANNSYLNINTAGKYRLKLTQGNCISYSNEIEIKAGAKLEKPVFQNQPVTSICSGSFNLAWISSATLYKDGVAITNNIANYNITQSGTYTVKRDPNGSCASDLSEPITLTFGSFNPKISTRKTVLCGTNESTSITFNNLSVGTFTFQWQKDNVDLAGKTTSNIDYVTEGTYRCRVTNGSCTEYSNEIIITRNNNAVYEIKSASIYGVSSDPNLACTNRLLRLEASTLVYLFDNTYTWFKDGQQVFNTKTDNSFYTSEAGTYTAIITNNSGCNATTAPFVVASDYVARPTITQSPTNTGASATLTATGCTGTINWYDALSGGANLGTGVTLITPNLNEATFYYTDCTTSDCKSARAKYLVNLNDCTSMYTLKSGDWRDPEIWSCGRIPVETDLIAISQGHNIEVLYGDPIIKTLTVSGNLKFENGAGLVLKKD